MSKLLENLNPSQQEAVKHVDGPLLMLAGPGSGKTRVVTHRIAYLIEQGVSPWQILALTFTNKAAQEMRARIERIVGQAPPWMGTFHSFCARMLRRYSHMVGLPENFTIYDADSAEEALRNAIQNANIELTHLTISNLVQKVSRLKNKLVLPENLQAEAVTSDERILARVYPAYQEYLLRNAAVDFDDLLLHMATMLRQSPELRYEFDSKFKYIMVDEYQDTNLVQYVIVRSMSVNYPNLAVTGDPDQSIYSWRGADIKNILNFERDFPNVKTIKLEQNYRSTPEILAVADALIVNNTHRKAKVLVPTRTTGSKVRVHVYRTGKDEARDVIDQIANLVSTGQTKLSDCAILYRTNAHSRLFEIGLRSRGIPYQMIGGFQFYQRREIKDLLSYLHLLYNPSDDIAFARVVNTPTRGVGKQALNTLQAFAAARRLPLLEAARLAIQQKAISARALTGLREFISIYDAMIEQSRGRLVDLMQWLIDRIGYEAYLTKQRREEGDADVMENVTELLADAAELDESETEGNALQVFIEQAALYAETDRFEESTEKVTLMTLHAAKGLEFSCVFVVAVEQGILPHQRSREDPMQFEEERRLFFVGITRAKNYLQISCAKMRTMRGNHSPSAASSFLMELPRCDLHFIDDTEQGFGFGDMHYDHDEDSLDDSFDFGFEEDPAPVRAKAKLKVAPIDEYAQVATDDTTDELPVFGDSISEDHDATRVTSQASPDSFKVGCLVNHPKYGSGRVTAASGKGPKRTVAVEFFADSMIRNFVLKFVPLTLESTEN